MEQKKRSALQRIPEFFRPLTFVLVGVGGRLRDKREGGAKEKEEKKKSGGEEKRRGGGDEERRKKEGEGEDFELKAFFDEINAMGNIPISLGHWKMTGVDEHLRSSGLIN